MQAPINDIKARWASYHQDIATRHEAFARLPRCEREAAFQAVRAEKGSKVVTVDEMLEAHLARAR
jgi:hypothetical protein